MLRSKTPSEPAPLTEAQLGLWFAQRLDPANPIYNTGQYLVLRGPLRVEDFAEAVDRALAESDALAVRIVERDEGPFQIVDEAMRSRLETIDLSTHPDPRADALRAMRDDMATALDPTRDRLARECLFVLGPERFLWYQRLHHLVIDGFGTALLTQRIAELYSAGVEGRESGKPLTPYTAVLEEDAAYRRSERREKDRRFWLDAFRALPEIVGLVPGAPLTAHDFHRVVERLPQASIAGLQKAAEGHEIPWPDILTGLVGAFLARHLQEDRVVVGVPVMGRLGAAGARTACMVMNILPVTIEVDEDTPLGDYFAAVAARLAEARRHGRYRSEQLRRDLNLLGGGRRLYGPLVNVLPFDAPLYLSGVEASLHRLGTGAVDDLTFTFHADGLGNGLLLELDANPRLYAETEVEALARRLVHFLGSALGASHLSSVPLPTPDEMCLIAKVNATARALPDTTLTVLIEQSMRARPDAPAVVFGKNTLDYAELDRRTAALAARLYAAGIRQGNILAVLLPRSCELVIALVAILRAGAAYLPLDPDDPPERLQHIINAARPAGLVAQSNDTRLPDGIRRFTVGSDDVTADLAVPTTDPPRPDDAAYVIYTSGSTGAPKGVVIEHRSIVNRLEWMRVHYGIGRDERILQKTPATFDVSVWEFFLPLLAGGTLVVAPPDSHKDPAWLAAIIRDERITTLHFVPSMLAAFLAEPAAAGLDLRRVFCSGEELPAELRDRFHTLIRAELHNLYGPTEAAVDVSYWPAPPDDRSVPVPIGLPVWNTQLHLLDSRRRLLPPGVSGELHIGGCQVARGYLHRPDLTAERFIADPFSDGRMYRTGDLARRRRDGALEFLGRSDHQIKIRGRRIELGEIEAALLGSGLVSEGAIVAREDRPGEKRIIAYVVPHRDEAGDTAGKLKTHMATRLPDYMIPTAFVLLDALPVTRNGKLDRAALPPPQSSPRGGGRTLSPVEQTLAGLFAEVLGLGDAPIGVEDDFFDLGGHSLLAARLMLRIGEIWGRNPGLGIVFAHSTVGSLAREIDRIAAADDIFRPDDDGLGGIVRLAEGDPDLPPLFCIHPAGGLAWCYRELARALRPARPVYGLQANGIDPAKPLPRSLDEIARDYAGRIATLRPDGRVHLAGWSVGGLIAHAVAVRLQRSGRTVGVLAMLDSYPADCWRQEPEVGEEVMLKALLHMADVDPEAFGPAALTREHILTRLRESGHPLAQLPGSALEGIMRVVGSNNRLVREHVHGVYDGRLLHFRASLKQDDRDLPPFSWSPYVGAIDIRDVPSAHANLTGPAAIRYIAPVLSAGLAGLDRA